MRVPRAVRSSLEGLAAGYGVALVAAFWLKTAVPDADLVWNLVSPFRIAAWILGSAHGVPLEIRTAAGLRSSDAPGSIERLGELLGGDSDLVFSFSLFLAPITILAICGVLVARRVRSAQPSSGRQVLAWTGLAAATHGVVLGLASLLGSYEFAAEGTLAPELGLEGASGRIAIAIGQSPIVALLIGAAWGAAFAAAGGLSSLRMRSQVAAGDRVVLLGWLRGLGAATAIVAGALVAGGIFALVTGRAPSPSLLGLGLLLLSGNAIAAAIVGSSGASMAVALDAGPFTGWERVDLLNVGAAGNAMPATWLALLIPLTAGIVAGRFARRRSDHSDLAIALRFGALWGLSLAVLAMLLRVRVLSSFSVGGLELGGGSAAFDPLMALLTGLVVGTISAFIGTKTVRRDEAGAWTCPECEITNTDADRFCVSCGTPRPSYAGSQSGA